MFSSGGTSASVYDRSVKRSGLSETQRCVLSQVPDGATVLELGPASGYMTRAMTARGCQVDAIELNPQDATEAAPHCRKLVVGSAEDPRVFADLTGPYRVAVMADVLEHLRTPDETLRLVAQRLAPNGEAIVSLPNIAYWKMRWDLLRGRFEYKDYGLLDRTHLRFFTRKTAEELFHSAGFELSAIITPPPKVKKFGPFKELVKVTWPSVFALQIVYRLRLRAAS